MATGTSISRGSVDEAHRLAQADPARAIQLVERVMAEPDIDKTEQAKAMWARGLAERELDLLDASADSLSTAIALAEKAGDIGLSAEIKSSLAWLRARIGENEVALSLISEAAPHLTGAASARNEMQRGLILQRLGRHREALASYESALEGLLDAGDEVAAARLRLNRSVLYVYSGELPAAVEDLEAAHDTAVRLNQDLLVAACAHNLGFAEGRRGDIPRALRWFEIAEQAFDRLGSEHRKAALYADRAEVYAEAGLVTDALHEAHRAVEELRDEGEEPALADALLTLARLADVAGDRSLAVQAATEARPMFASQGRNLWELQARYMELIGRLDDLETPDDSDQTWQLIESLEDQGWEAEATRVRLEAARVSFERRDESVTRRYLARLDSTNERTDLAGRLARAEARYMLAVLDGRSADANAEIRRGITLLDRYRAAAASVEIRARMAQRGVRLVGAAIDLAMADGSPWRVLQAVETWRSRSMEFPPVRPSEDESLAEAANALRAVEADLRSARQAGAATVELERRRIRLERIILDATRRREADSDAVSLPLLEKRELTERLGERALVAYFQRQGRLHAVHYDGRRWHLEDLGEMASIEQAIDGLRFSVYRLVQPHVSEAAQAAHMASLVQTASELSSVLVEGLGLPDVPITIVPTGSLHRLPWSLLPSLAGRPFVISPSVRAWMRAEASKRPLRTAVAIAGADLVAARAEVERVARIHPGTQRLTGRNATVARSLQVLATVDIAHVAAHGDFRSDNPLLSSLRLHDGSLTVHDLDRLDQVPSVLVLPACESGVSDVGADDELLGLAAALLRMGVIGLVAPVTPIPDESTRPLMVRFHRNLRDTGSPEVALADAVAATQGESPREVATAGSFVLLGA